MLMSTLPIDGWRQFQRLLDEQTQWPSAYLFKCILPSTAREEIVALFPEFEVVFKSSRKGNYLSASIDMVVHSSDEVRAMYERVQHIPGIMLL